MRWIIFCFFALFFTPAFADSSAQTTHSKATLITDYDAVKAGGSITAGLLLQPTEGWHTYWENPGDAGISTQLSWTLPEGVTAGDIQWPTPTRIQEDQLAIYGYVGDVLLPVTITVPEQFSESSLTLTLQANWLVCEQICIPEQAALTLEIPVSDAPQETSDHAAFQSAKAALPGRMEAPLSFSLTKDSLALTIPEYLHDDASVLFFPRETDQIIYAQPQRLEGHVLHIPRNPEAAPISNISGILTIGSKAYDIRAEKTDAPPTPTEHAAPSAYSFLGLLLFALIGGLLLNLMPCVLPVLSLKALAIAKKSGHDRHIIIKQALAYSAGVLLSFALIATILIGLQTAGETIGWGFQMQSPAFVGFLAMLLFLVALNLAGMFELPVLFGSALSDTPQHGLRGSFATGILATMVATPCTAPFMATAIGATLTLPPAFAFSIFLAIGLGLSLPFLMIALFPRLIALLPKPGAWMLTFKELMAFPMFASVVWLLWVLVQQTGPSGLLVLLVTMLTVAFIIWLKGRCRDQSPFCKIAIIFLLLAALVNGLTALSFIHQPLAASSEQAFTRERLQALRDAGTPVFVDATAAWCLTCQVNAKRAIHTPASQQAFAETGTTLLIADWTNRNPEITEFLESFGYNGVPLYVYFPAHGEPIILPQLINESDVIRAVRGQNVENRATE